MSWVASLSSEKYGTSYSLTRNESVILGIDGKLKIFVSGFDSRGPFVMEARGKGS